MFQYAAGLALAEHVGTELHIDDSRYDQGNEWRMYSLGLFKGCTERRVKAGSGRIIVEQGMPYNPDFFACGTKNCTIRGYWQTEKYFANLRAKLRAKFSPGSPLHERELATLERIKREGPKPVFLTVRRTDYVGNDFHGLLPMSYYLGAAEMIASRITDPKFFVFTDDVEWCEREFRLPYRMEIAGNFDRTVKPHLGREDAELWLMSWCAHAVMANSSYSWWGAWLGADNHGGIVVAPKNWFGPKGTEDARDIVPERWVKI